MVAVGNDVADMIGVCRRSILHRSSPLNVATSPTIARRVQRGWNDASSPWRVHSRPTYSGKTFQELAEPSGGSQSHVRLEMIGC